MVKGCPTLAIAYENGRAQIMRNERDDKPVLIDTLMRIARIQWSPNGSVIAFAGTQVRSMHMQCYQCCNMIIY